MCIRKPVYELTPDDLDRFPIWEFALDEEGIDGQDEATVRPVEPSAVVDAPEGPYIVRARFTLADGTVLLGQMTVECRPQDKVVADEDEDRLNRERHPAIVTTSGQVQFWSGIMKPDDQYLAASYRILGEKLPAAVFPIAYSSDVDLPYGAIRGRLSGFLFLETLSGSPHRIIRSLT